MKEVRYFYVSFEAVDSDGFAVMAYRAISSYGMFSIEWFMDYVIKDSPEIIRNSIIIQNWIELTKDDFVSLTGWTTSDD